jgi:hypothetical protein
MTTVQIYDARQNRVVTLEKMEKSDAEWKKLLAKKQYEITTKKGTEAPGWGRMSIVDTKAFTLPALIQRSIAGHTLLATGSPA